MLVKNASTDVTTYFVLRDSTNHAPKADVTITDIDLYYTEERAAQSVKVDATELAAADSAHGDNQAFHCGNGLYRIDWPDAAFDGGIGKKVTLIVVCTGVDTTFLEVELSAPVDAVAVSGDATAADNAELAFDGTGFGFTGCTMPTTTAVTNAVTTGTISNGAITAAAIATGAIDADALAADAVDEILDEVIEGTVTMRQALRAFLAAVAGKADGGGTATIHYRNQADDKNVITLTVDAAGDRSATVLDFS